ncbi:hypothetical protein IWW45_008741, partial [Coemansia sp. RSA 485]
MVFLIDDLGVSVSTPVLLCDNQAAAHASRNGTVTDKNKHLCRATSSPHFYSTKKTMQLRHVPAVNQQADFLTKALPLAAFQQGKQA